METSGEAEHESNSAKTDKIFFNMGKHPPTQGIYDEVFILKEDLSQKLLTETGPACIEAACSSTRRWRAANTSTVVFVASPIIPSYLRIKLTFDSIIRIIDPSLPNGITDPFPSSGNPPGNVLLKNKKCRQNKYHQRRKFDRRLPALVRPSGP